MKMKAQKVKTMIRTKKNEKPKINITIDYTNIEQVNNLPTWIENK